MISATDLDVNPSNSGMSAVATATEPDTESPTAQIVGEITLAIKALRSEEISEQVLPPGYPELVVDGLVFGELVPHRDEADRLEFIDATDAVVEQSRSLVGTPDGQAGQDVEVLSDEQPAAALEPAGQPIAGETAEVATGGPYGPDDDRRQATADDEPEPESINVASHQPGGNGRYADDGLREVEAYDYRDENGKLLYQSVRLERDVAGQGKPRKSFRLRRPDPRTGRWIWDIKGVERALYRLQKIARSSPGDLVIVLEGERKVHAIEKLGLTGTCNSMGAGKWDDRYSAYLLGCHVVILPDNDKPGRDHGQAVAKSVHGKAASVKIVELPDLPPKGDIIDWLEAGGTREKLLELIQATPVWSPPASPCRPPVTASTATRTMVVPTVMPTEPGRPQSYLQNYLKNAAARVANATEERHNTLFKETCGLASYLHYGIGYTEEELTQTMVAAGRQAEPPPERDDHERTVRDAIKKGRENPRELPDRELHELALQSRYGPTIAIGQSGASDDGMTRTAPVGQEADPAGNDELPKFAGGFDRSGRPRTIIRMTSDFHVAVGDTAEAMTLHPEVYARCGRLAVVSNYSRISDGKPETGLRRDAGSPVIRLLEVDTARVAMSNAARFQKFDGRKNDWVYIAPPKDLAAAVLGLGRYPGVRELVGITEAPTMRPDGSVLDTPGYDLATGLLYRPNAVFPAIPDCPGLEDAKTASQVILRLVTDFPFASESDRAAWLAYLLTVIVRGAIEGPVPMFLFSANVAGIGKTTLAELPPLIATGRHPAMDGYTPDNAEMEKRLTALAIGGDRCVIFDNAENGSRIGGAALDRAVMAKGAFRGRILGSSQMSSPEVPWSAVVAVTGNNISTCSDTRRRTVPCYLSSPVAKPEERNPETFRVFRETGRNLEQYVVENRPVLVTAALTIVRAYVAAGRPKVGLTSVDFPTWSDLIRGCVMWVCGSDPAGSRDRLEEEDETTSGRNRLVIAWRMLCEAADEDSGESDEARKAVNRGLTAAEAASKLVYWNAPSPGLKGHQEVLDAFSPFAPKGIALPDATRLGYMLRKERGAPTMFGTITQGTIYKGSNRWLVDGWVPPNED